jgi:hypothetical protein
MVAQVVVVVVELLQTTDNLMVVLEADHCHLDLQAEH